MTHLQKTGTGFLVRVFGTSFWCVCHWHKCSPRRRCLCGSAYTMKLQAIWLTYAFRSRLHKRRPEFLCSLQASSSLSMDRVHGTAYPQPYVHRTSRCAHSSASWSPTCSLTEGFRSPNNRPAPLWLYSEMAPHINRQTYLPTYVRGLAGSGREVIKFYKWTNKSHQGCVATMITCTCFHKIV